MPSKGRKRSAPKQGPHCQEQIKDILRRLERLEANTPKIKVMQFPPRRDLERFITEVPAEWIVSEVLRSLPPKKRKR